MSNKNPLGNLAIKGEERDAVHIPLLPIEAGEVLSPGQDVQIRNGKAYTAPNDEFGIRHEHAIGIVDSYLKDAVRNGDYFYIMVYPNTVTSMKHVWEHPDIDKAQSGGSTRSRAWMIWFAEEAKMSYDEVMQAADYWLLNDDYHTQHDRMDAQEALYGKVDEFWEHYQDITGKDVPGHKKEHFFSCSC